MAYRFAHFLAVIAPRGAILPDLSDDIETAAAEPLKASVDGQSVESRSIDDIIKADQYLAGKTATTSGQSAWSQTRMAKASFPSGGPH